MSAWPPRTPWTPAALAARALLGIAIGLGLALAAAALLWASGAYRLEAVAPRPPPVVVLGLPLFAWIEELLFRRLLLDRLAGWWGRTAGLLASAAAFAAVHRVNPGGASVAAMLGVFLAGLWMGQLYLQRRRLVACTAAHLAWNAGLGPLIGLPVSGIDLGGLARWSAAGGELATGGAFGPEASVWSWGPFAVAIVALEIVHRRRRRSSTPQAAPPAAPGPSRSGDPG